MTAYSAANPWLDDGDLRLYHGDVLAVLRTLPTGIAQTCVTSPPYWGLRDYGTGTWTGGDPNCDHALPKQADRTFTNGRGENEGYAGSNLRAWTTRDGSTYGATCGKCGAQRVDDQLGLEATPDAYIARMVEVFREVRRVLRADATLWLNIGDSYAADHAQKRTRTENYGLQQGIPGSRHRDSRGAPPGLKGKDLVGIPWRLALALQTDGWYLRSDIIWSKPNPMPESVTDRPTKAHEYVFLFSKQPRYFYDADAVREASITNDPRRPYTSEGAWKMDGRPYEQRHGGQARNGQDFSARNLRSVWQIATQPFPEAHFATYPEELVRRCILAGTSERGGCAECGAPWRRVTDVDYEDAPGGSPMKNHTNTKGVGEMGVRVNQRALKRVETTGWGPSCSCFRGSVGGDPPPRPQLVLDPFIGSGTTALVARKHGRRSIGIDLSAEYLEIAARRTSQLSLLGAAR